MSIEKNIQLNRKKPLRLYELRGWLFIPEIQWLVFYTTQEKLTERKKYKNLNELIFFVDNFPRLASFQNLFTRIDHHLRRRQKVAY